MAYHELARESGGSPDDRRAEADRLLRIIDEFDLDQMTPSEHQFCEQMYDDETQPISAKQLFWLRDIKDKYL